MNKIDATFLTYACKILADTNTGLSGSQIIEYCNAYSLDFNKIIKYVEYPFDAPNKRTALKENLNVFTANEQFTIIKELCELPQFAGNEQIEKLKERLFIRYGNLAIDKFSNTELIIKTKHWLSEFPEALKQYEAALTKFEGNIFDRNILDDVRLSFELLLKSLLNNDKSLENQISLIGNVLKDKSVSVEVRSMLQKLIDYYTKYQNKNVKHNDNINKDEIEYLIELTSVMMKFLIKVLKQKV